MKKLVKDEFVYLRVFFHQGSIMNIHCTWGNAQTFMADFRRFLRFKYAPDEEKKNLVGEAKVNYFFMSDTGELENMVDFPAVAACGIVNIPKEEPAEA